MKPFWWAVAGLALSLPAWGQPLRGDTAPLQQQWQQDGSPPVQQAPLSPLSRDQSSPSPGAIPPTAGTPAPGPATMERPNVWVSATVAKVQALDKVNAQTALLTIKVGQSVTFGSLTITAKACAIRPADQPADSAAFLTVTDSHPDTPVFAGWMLENEPSVSMMQHPIYDLRVAGCT